MRRVSWALGTSVARGRVNWIDRADIQAVHGQIPLLGCYLQFLTGCLVLVAIRRHSASSKSRARICASVSGLVITRVPSVNRLDILL